MTSTLSLSPHHALASFTTVGLLPEDVPVNAQCSTEGTSESFPVHVLSLTYKGYENLGSTGEQTHLLGKWSEKGGFEDDDDEEGWCESPLSPLSPLVRVVDEFENRLADITAKENEIKEQIQSVMAKESSPKALRDESKVYLGMPTAKQIYTTNTADKGVLARKLREAGKGWQKASKRLSVSSLTKR